MIIKSFSLVLGVASFLVFTVSALAGTASITGTTDSAVTIRKPIQAIQEQREMMLKNRQETKAMLKDTKEDLKEKLNVIRDEKKKVLVEKIDDKITTMNKTHTAKFSAVLEKLMMILNKITDRAQNAKLKGVDTSTVDSAIEAAKKAIDVAKAAVTTQSAKTYSIEVTSETTLKTKVGRVVSMFRKDLRDVHKIVVDAKQAVQKAERELAKAHGEQIEKKALDNRIKEIPSVNE
ncbi:MAG: hypothetical protein AAB600_03240 [Patescibacteria group bacterium]